MWCLLHLSHCAALVRTRSVERKVSSRMTLSTPQNRRYLRILRLSVPLLFVVRASAGSPAGAARTAVFGRAL
jgi:hypothetical protein